MNPTVINLADFLPSGMTILTSRPWGVALRNSSKIDLYALGKIPIIINIPEYITAITPSFLEEFLGNAIHYYGPDFRRLVRFDDTKGRYKVNPDLDVLTNNIPCEEIAYEEAGYV